MIRLDVSVSKFLTCKANRKDYADQKKNLMTTFRKILKARNSKKKGGPKNLYERSSNTS